MDPLRTIQLFYWLLLLPAFQSYANPSTSKDSGQRYYDNVMGSVPYLPANLSDTFISCPLSNPTSKIMDNQYRTSKQVNYQKSNWEQRITANWDYFDSTAAQGRILAIDFQQQTHGLGYRYLANDQTQDQLYEPWSSSKIMAFTAAVAKARQSGVGANSLAGNTPLADLITSIHSYQPFGKADAPCPAYPDLRA